MGRGYHYAANRSMSGKLKTGVVIFSVENYSGKFFRPHLKPTY